MTGLIVGASGGIGSACAEALATSANRLLLVARSRDRLVEIARNLPNGEAVAADIATSDGVERVAAAVGDSRLSWVVIASGVPLRGRVEDSDASRIVDTITTNLIGPALLIHRLLRCEWSSSASIVAIGSISASRALPNRAVYGGSKAGLEHMCRSLAAELAPRGIRINVVSPGVIETPFLGDNVPAIQAWIDDRVPARRLGTALEVANVVKYILLDAPAFLTGARIAIDGGAEAVG